jgi:hypothetical protein
VAQIAIGDIALGVQNPARAVIPETSLNESVKLVTKANNIAEARHRAGAGRDTESGSVGEWTRAKMRSSMHHSWDTAAGSLASEKISIEFHSPMLYFLATKCYQERPPAPHNICQGSS